ncbi:hypothetical protein FB559_0783 [Actinoallomurus bryophytorum]|uniref:Uncharacterized protein n=1 Tax=Actinoallomurus bryophytorum TaxID=1490222 RepID=A0A543CDV0_9ACTN|nr:hypothetical protein FB559_0783 [Actinoallomurus bryophytorum]
MGPAMTLLDRTDRHRPHVHAQYGAVHRLMGT